MRKLKADEIECRVAQVFEKGCSLHLYKTARVDRAILDEEFGKMGWQNDFKLIDGKMYGGIGVYNNDLDEWVWKWDCGTESNTEAEKGQASDCFKRAGFKWGIGIELYSAPFIFVNVPTIKNEKGKFELVDKYQKFEVSEIVYTNNGDISNLKIKSNKKVIFEMNEFIPDFTEAHIKQIQMCSDRSELELYWAGLSSNEKNNPKILKAFKEMGTKYPKLELVKGEDKGEIKEVIAE